MDYVQTLKEHSNAAAWRDFGLPVGIGMDIARFVSRFSKDLERAPHEESEEGESLFTHIGAVVVVERKNI